MADKCVTRTRNEFMSSNAMEREYLLPSVFFVTVPKLHRFTNNKLSVYRFDMFLHNTTGFQEPSYRALFATLGDSPWFLENSC